jgi:hypothetical protein
MTTTDGRVHLPGGGSIPLTTADIEVGDFIASKDCPACCGFVTKIGNVPFGERKLPGYWVRMANGAEDFIPCADAAIMGLGKEEE